MTRQRRHQWSVPQNGKVTCSRCKIEVSVDEARRGIGPCTSKRQAVVQENKPQQVVKQDIDMGTCGACGQRLKQVPFNSRLDMIACVNRRCELYRQRLRFAPSLSVAERLARA